MTEEKTLPDGRKIEEVPVKIPPVIAQALTRIAAAEVRVKNVATVHEALILTDQYGHIVRNGAAAIKKFADTIPNEDPTKLDLLNVVEELEIVAAMGAKLWYVIKTHPKKDDTDQKKIRDDGLSELMKMSQNAGAAVREYLLAVADAEKTQAEKVQVSPE